MLNNRWVHHIIYYVIYLIRYIILQVIYIYIYILIYIGDINVHHDYYIIQMPTHVFLLNPGQGEINSLIK